MLFISIKTRFRYRESNSIGITAFVMTLSMILSPFSYGQNAVQKKILSQKDRPLPASYINQPGALAPISDAFGGGADVDSFTKLLPKIIVGLEKGFPNATFGFLGRDMDLIADAIDAFYMDQGIQGKVARIKFSTGSMAGLNEPLAAKFLATSGLDMTKSSNPRPFVLIDYTSFSIGSQSTFLFNSAFNELEKKGFTDSQILQRINVVSIQEAYGSAYKPFSSKMSPAAFRAKQTQALQSGSLDSSKIAYIPAEIAYGSEWHATWGPVRMRNGKPVTAPTSYFGANQKKSVFVDIISVMSQVRTPEFKARVQGLLAERGIRLTGTRGQKAISSKAMGAELKKDFLNRLKPLGRLKALGSQYTVGKEDSEGLGMKLTTNGAKVARAILIDTIPETPMYAEITLSALLGLYNDNKIGGRDFRRILRSALGSLELSKREVTKLRQLISNNIDSAAPLLTLAKEGQPSQALTLISKNLLTPPQCRGAYD